MLTATGRAVVGLLVVSSAVAAGVLVSPSTTMEAAASLTADPTLFALLVVGLYLVRPLFAWPTTPLAIVVGYGYGVALGVPIALLGVVATVLPVFFGVRWLTGTGPTDNRDTGIGATADRDIGTGSDTETASADRSRWLVGVGGTVGQFVDRTGTAIDRYYETAGPLRGVIALRLAPIPSDVSTAAAAVSDVRVRHLAVGTAIGELPWTIAAVVVGASAATVTTGGLGEVGLVLSVACLVAAGLLLAGPAYRVVRRRRRTGQSGQSVEG